jgi:hypothetical protein
MEFAAKWRQIPPFLYRKRSLSCLETEVSKQLYISSLAICISQTLVAKLCSAL